MKKESISNDSGIREMINNAECCLNCGKKLSYLQRKEGRRNGGYCSMFCLSVKPQKMAYAEKVYGKQAKELILEMLNNGATVTATAGRLGVNKQALYQWLDKLGIKKKVVWG
jgi:DNA invertase Pin-like site-specific DNA recombinase